MTNRRILTPGSSLWVCVLLDGFPPAPDKNNLILAGITEVTSRSVTVINPIQYRIDLPEILLKRPALESRSYEGVSVKAFRNSSDFIKWSTELNEMIKLRKIIYKDIHRYNLAELRRIAKVVGIKDH